MHAAPHHCVVEFSGSVHSPESPNIVFLGVDPMPGVDPERGWRLQSITVYSMLIVFGFGLSLRKVWLELHGPECPQARVGGHRIPVSDIGFRDKCVSDFRVMGFGVFVLSLRSF